jgi:hypothetical protein
MKYDIILLTDLSTRVWQNKPLGAYRLASSLRSAGFSVKVVDYFSTLCQDFKILFQILDLCVGPDTKWIGFSSVFYSQINHTQITNWQDFYSTQLSDWPVNDSKLTVLLREIKKRYAHVKLVYGGKNFIPDTQFKFIDHIVVGLADTSAVYLSENIDKDLPKVIDQDRYARNFDFSRNMLLYQPEDHLFPGEVIAMETSRGCLFKCSFCAYPLIGRKKSDPEYHKHTDVITAELINNKKYGITKYMFVDDTFNETTEKLQSILSAKQAADVDMEFSAYLRVDLLHRYPDQIKILRDMGIRSAFLGIETLNLASGKAIGKSTDPERVKDTLHTMRQIWGKEVSIFGSFILGLPADTPDNLQWIDWVLDNDNPLDSFNFSVLGIDHHNGFSDIGRNPEKYGYKIDHNGKWISRGWNQIEAEIVQEKLMTDSWNSGRLRLSGWDYMGLQNMGYDHRDLIDKPVKDLNFPEIKSKKQKLYSDYIKILLEYEKGIK